MHTMLHIDGSQGEGGGQILRTALALSAVTATPVRIERIRAGRAKPGLQRQHLTAVLAAAQVSGAQCDGATLHSTGLTFTPQQPLAGTWHFDIGTAGSTTLVLQTVLPILLSAAGPSTVTIRGGTHNPLSPTVEFLTESLLPLLQGTGIGIDLELVRHGFYPAGGGEIRAHIRPGHATRPLDLAERGPLRSCTARVLLAHLAPRIAEREAFTLTRALGWSAGQVDHRSIPADGPGNALIVQLRHAALTTVVSAIGDRRRTAEAVAQEAAALVQAHLQGTGAVCPHLADQLMLPLVLGAGGSYTTGTPTPHTLTNAAIIGRFLGTDAVRCTEEAAGRWRITVQGRAGVTPPPPGERRTGAGTAAGVRGS